MPHFYCPTQNFKENTFLLTIGESHHLLNVLRKKAGDRINIFDGKGNSYIGEISGVKNGKVFGKIIEYTPSSKESKNFGVRLFISPLKKQKLDEIIEKAAQLGVAEIIPVISERTVVKISVADTAKNTRWNLIALAASKQSGRTDIMNIAKAVGFTEAVDYVSKTSNSLNLIAWESEETIGVKDVLMPIAKAPASVNLFVGPEGGYSIGEIEFARNKNFKTVSLGEKILKSDTAAIYLVSIIQYMFGE